LNPNASTLRVHVDLVKDGLVSAYHEPLGLGVASVSLAGQRFASRVRVTEADPSNVAVALGIIGLVLYLVIVVEGFRRAFRVASRRRDPISLAAIGIMAVTFLAWLNGGEYAVAWLPWLALGWIDRRSAEE
jgi:hypothetical protein